MKKADAILEIQKLREEQKNPSMSIGAKQFVEIRIARLKNQFKTINKSL